MADASQNFILRIRAIAEMKDATRALEELRRLTREVDAQGVAVDRQEQQNREAEAAIEAKAAADRESAAAAREAAAAAKEAAAAEEERATETRQAEQATEANTAAMRDHAPAAGQAAAANRNFTKQAADATRPTQNTAMGVLELSRAYEDLQYGIRGVLNNIPSMILAFGGSAGLAGVLSLAAVAGSQLWSALSGDGGEKQKALAAAEEAKQKLDEILSKYRAMGVERAKLAQDNYLSMLQSESDEIEHQTALLRMQAEQARETAKLQYELRQAQRERERAAIEQRGLVDPSYAAGGMGADLGALDRAAAADQQAQRMAGLEERLEDLKREEMRVQEAAIRSAQQIEVARGRLEAAEGELADAKRQQVEAEFAAAQATKLYAEEQRKRAEAAQKRRMAEETDFVTGQRSYPSAGAEADAATAEADALRARADALAARAAENSPQAMAAKVAQAEAAAKAARDGLQQAESALDASIRESGQASELANEIRAGVEQQRQIIDQTFQTMNTTVDMATRLDELKAREAELRAAIEKAQAEATAGGRQMSAEFAEGMNTLETALADGFQALDIGKMVTAFNGFRNSNEAGLNNMAATINLMVQKLQALDAEQKRQQKVLQQIQP